MRILRAIEGSLLDAEPFGRGVLNGLGDGIAVQRSACREDLEHEEGERPLEDVVPTFRHRRPRIPI